MLKVGIIGAGFIGKTHANAYKTLNNLEIIGVSEVNEKAGRQYADEYNCAYFQDAESLVKREDIDIVDICLPTFLHEKYVIMAAEHGKHVLCEKPFTLTLESADRILEAVDKAKVTLMVAQVVRFWPEYVMIKQYYDSGKLGGIKMVYANRLAQHPNWSDWFKDVRKSGGGLFDLHLHDVDYMRYLLGPVESVYATGKQSENGAWNHVVTCMNFKSGSRACVEGAYEMTENYPFTTTLRAVGLEGTIDYNFSAGFNLENIGDAKSKFVYYKNGSNPEMLQVEQKDPYANEIEYFVNCIAERKKPKIILPAESREVLEIMLAIQKSLETGEIQLV
jgi:UDP-N-acetylglucosamine 3-dehydrogenase